MADKMPNQTATILGIAGPSGSGKTTLIERIIPLLMKEGVRVSTLKHVHHDLDLDKPGKDSFRHRQAGAEQVMVALPSGWALFNPDTANSTYMIPDLAEKMDSVDLILVEGYRSLPINKIEVFNSSLGQPLNQPHHSSVIAVAGDIKLENLGVPTFIRDDIRKIVAFIINHCNS